MSETYDKNIHVPLSGSLHARLMAECERSGRPATSLTREAIATWLTERERMFVREAVARYANAAAGGQEDLDESLEAAGVEYLLEATEEGEGEP